MAIKRIQQMGVYGITTGHPEEREQEMICCPELDREGYGRANLSKASCLYRQQDEEFKVPTCYGGCKGRRPVYVRPKTDITRESRQRAVEIRVKEAEIIRTKIIELHEKGLDPTTIADEVGRGRSLVEKRLHEAGVVIARGYGPDSLKQQIMRWLDENKEAKTKDVAAAFTGTPKGTCESYLTQWKRRNR